MKRLLALTASTVALAGCTDLLFPYEKPATPTPQTFREVPDAAKNAAPDAAANVAANPAPVWPDKDWWKQFNSPELTSLMEQALKNNNDLGAAVARLKQANAEVLINGAPLLPSVELDAGGSHTHSNRTASGTGTTSSSHNSSSYNAGLSASYELDFWGKNYSALLSAQASRDASAFDLEVVRLTVTSSVATVYFDLLATDARLANAQADLKAAQGLLDALQLRFKQGTASALDVAQQVSLVAQQNSALPPLILQQSKDLDALAILVGALPESLPRPASTLADIAVPEVPAGLASSLLERRPDVAEAEASLRAAHANINEARAAFLPDITLTGQAGYASTALGSLFKPGGFLTTFGLNLVQPIFEGGLLVGGLDLTQAQYEELLQNYHKAVLSAFADTEDSLASVKQNAAQQTAEAEAQKAANDAYKLTQQQFDAGIVDITSVLNTERSLYGANDALIAAKLAHLQAMAGLYKSLGGGWNTDAPQP